MFLLLLSFSLICADVHDFVNGNNISQVTSSKQIYIVNFFASWCIHCTRFRPKFLAAAQKTSESAIASKVGFASFDCVADPQGANKIGIDKFPTILLYRKGIKTSIEYHGDRSPEGLYEFAMLSQIIEPLQIKSADEMDKNALNIYMATNDLKSHEYEIFKEVAEDYVDSCKFYVIKNTNPSKPYFIHHKADISFSRFSEFEVKTDFKIDLKSWVNNNCYPFVVKLTLNNAERYLLKRMPLFVLFYSETTSSTQLKEFVNQLEAKRDVLKDFGVYYADYHEFSNALKMVQKSAKDLPFLVLDDFKKVYYFGSPTNLKTASFTEDFVRDYKSGALYKKLEENRRHVVTYYEVVIKPDGKAEIHTKTLNLDESEVQDKNELQKKIPKEHIDNKIEIQSISKEESLLSSIFKLIKPGEETYNFIKGNDEL